MWRWLAVALVLALAGPVHANGRAPLTTGIVLRPGHPNTIYLATTFGLLISDDDGCTSGKHCNTTSNTCVDCASDMHCSGGTPACNMTTNTCVQCTSDMHCTAPATCMNNMCM